MHWKVYWKLEPSTLQDIKIVHFHGPKPGSGVEEMARCDVSYNNVANSIPAAYHFLLEEAICCDHGHTAATILQLYHAWHPDDMSVICKEL
jgi:hypothetical protein